MTRMYILGCKSYRTFFSNSNIFKVFVRNLANGYHVHFNKVSIFIHLINNSTWLITSELANQRARKVLFTCVVYTNSR